MSKNDEKHTQALQGEALLKLMKYIDSEKERMNKQREKFLDERDYKSFMKWEKGITEFTLEAVIPRDHLSFGKDKKVFRITVGGELFDWSVNPLSPMYRDLLDRLAVAPVVMRLQRMGDGLQTRYELV